MPKAVFVAIFASLLLVSIHTGAGSLDTSFTYQGELKANGNVTEGIYDFEIELFDVISGGTPIAGPQFFEDIPVETGNFSLELDFGSAPFDGDQLWLGIGVREGASGGGYQGIAPRQKLTATPFALLATDVADGSVGAQEINSAQVQRRVTGACTVGSYVQAVNQDGTVVCEAGLTQVTGADIVDGSVTGADLDPGASYTLGATTITDALVYDSAQDIRIHDDFNSLRWFDASGTEEFGFIFMSSTENQWIDTNASRYVFRSTSDGIAIGTSFINSGYRVSMPSLHVSGAASLGLVRVTAGFIMDGTTDNCHSHGNLTCYYGSGSVQCPVGTRVLGGGTNGSTGRYGSVSTSYPNSTTSWTCGSSYDLANSSRTCYALCARIE